MIALKKMWRWLDRPETQSAARSVSTAIICLSMLGIGAMFRLSALPAQADNLPLQAATSPASPSAAPGLPQIVVPAVQTAALGAAGIPRLALLHTSQPDSSGFEVTQYTVQAGDTIFGIAEKFGLDPSTILWGNLNKLADNPEQIYPGQVLNILPTDGIYYQWHEGDGLNGVARGYAVAPEDIVNYPGNHLDPETIGDYSHPNIAVGTWLIVPGGYRNFITWSAPTISRFNPSSARLYGPGACSKPVDGAVGTGTFTFPTVDHWLSGYDYAPGANHPAVDFGGAMGNAIYAADNGVIVYAGWNDWGYGNVTVIDHGNGYQTLYGHQSRILVGCGQSVSKGMLIGNMGSTGRSSGPHLHFEMWYNGSHVNPHDYLAITDR